MVHYLYKNLSGDENGLVDDKNTLKMAHCFLHCCTVEMNLGFNKGCELVWDEVHDMVKWSQAIQKRVIV